MCLSRARQRRRYHSRGFSFFSYLFARKHATGASETTNGGREGANKRANKKEKERERDRGRNVRTECARMRDRDWETERKTETRCNKKKERKRVRKRRGGEKKRAILREKRRDKERRVSCTANGRQTADRDSRASVRQVDQSDDDDDDDSAMMSRVSLVTVTRYFDTASRSISRRVARKTEHSDHLGGRGARARTHCDGCSLSPR